MPFAMKSLLRLLLCNSALASFVIFEPGLITNTTSVTLSSGCISALQATLQCDPYLRLLVGSDLYSIADTSVLDTLCSSGCGSSLKQYHSTVVSACAKDPPPWPGTPPQHYGDQIWAKYNLTCLKDDSGKYCQNWLQNQSLPSADTALADLPHSFICSSCIIKLGVLNQGTSYSNYGPKMAKDWSKILSICGVSHPTALPTIAANISSIPGYAPTGYPVASCPTNNFYTVASGDNCGSIAASKGVPRGSLISNNDVLPDCSDLQAGKKLCLPDKCTLRQVKSGDTCVSIANSTKVSFTQLLSWNPFLDYACTNLIAGDSICVSQPGQVWTGTPIAGASVTKTAIYATTTVTPSGATAHGTTKHCGKYYNVQSGDDCHLIAVNQTITIDLFKSINPDVNSGCTNLVPGLYYCVLPTADWNSTSSGSPTSTCSSVKAPAPTPTGTTPQCCQYYVIQNGDYCGKLESSFGITMAQLQLWNPNLLDDCSNLIRDEAYCVQGIQDAPSGGAPANSASTTKVKRALATQHIETNPRLANQWFEQADKVLSMRAILP